MTARPFHTLPRLYLPEPMKSGGNVLPSEDQAHYLLHVMRCQSGEAVRLFNGADGEWLGILQVAGQGKKTLLTLKIDQQLRPQAAEPDLWLCAAPIKRQHLEFMVMKAVELGISAFHPIATARTQLREAKLDRLHAIAIEAAEQAERLTITSILAIQPIDKIVNNWPKDRLPIICAEFGNAKPIQEALSTIPPNLTAKAAIFTGPEGGYTEDELKLLAQLPHATMVRLGSRILRADTAALAALACWQARHGDWK